MKSKTELVPSSEVIARVRKRADTVVLSFSGGKDSLACWLALSDAGFNIVPIFHYHVPRLKIQEEFLARCERHFNTQIIRVPHSILYQRLAAQSFQPPHLAPILEEMDFPTDSTLGEIKQFVIDDMPDVPVDAWVAMGTRATDSSSRRLYFKWHGVIREGNRTFYPIWDWTKAQIAERIERSGLALPHDYDIWGRSFDGVDYFFLKGLRDNVPEDYERVRDLFPLIDLEFARFNIAQEEGLLRSERSASRG